MKNAFTPLPTLILDERRFEWPQPPFARRNVMAPQADGAAPCRIETTGGAAVEGELAHFDPDAQRLRFRLDGGADAIELPFDKMRRLTLTAPWMLARRAPDAPAERVPAAAQEREYRVELAGGGSLVGRTMGHVLTDAGWFLFAPSDAGDAVRRVFVPRVACRSVSFGKSAEESAVDHWVATPEALVAAVQAQRHSRILSMGDSLLQLGLVTRGVLDLMVREQGADRAMPLGEMLVARGYIDRADLQTALAHKMGYPIVDLTRFPIDPQAVRKLSQKAILEMRVLPLMLHGRRLMVAVDDLARIARLKSLTALADLDITPVLAPRGRLSLVLAALPQRLGIDPWSYHVPLRKRVALDTLS